MPTTSTSPATRRSPAGRAFTLLEVLFSILVIGVLLGLLVVGLQAAGVFARGSADRQTVGAISLGVQRFQEQFGFAPPLVKDHALAPTAIEETAGTQFYAVYVPANAADILVLRPPLVPNDPSNPNPFLDRRYSELSLSFYLCGADDTRVLRTGAIDLPIDGVRGPGFFTPRRDGTFEIPRDLLRPTGAAESRRVSAQNDSLIALNSPNVTLGGVPEPIPAPLPPEFYAHPRLKDRNAVPIRYYVWIGGREQPANSGNFVLEDIADYNIPPLVGLESSPGLPIPEDRDPSKNIALRSAKWAIVAAGPNTVFGDEDINLIAGALKSPVPQDVPGVRAMRAKAAADNVVEVGQ